MNRALVAFAVLGAAAACKAPRGEGSYPPFTGGDARNGRELIHSYGCGACHTIPEVHNAHGKVGPPLTSFAQRSFIAGELPNTPENLTRWLINPKAVEPKTAMPKLGLQPQEARDVAAFLYTLD
jgi:cytochrome c2